MLKRNIGILIAGAVLSVQVNLAAADQGAFPMGADEPGRGIGSTLPALTKYLEERAAGLQGTTVRSDTFPPSENDIVGKMLPAQARYFEQRTATRQARKLDGSVAGDE